MNRILLNNIWLKLNYDKYVIMNLTSFRREYLTINNFKLFIRIANKINNKLPFDNEEVAYYKYLLSKKQIFTYDSLKEIDTLIKKSIKIPKKISGLMLNLTYNCNFKCTYCYQNDFKNDIQQKFMTIEDLINIKKLLNNYNNSDPDNITISGGEPLLPQNINTINKIFTFFPKSTISLYTNGENILDFYNQIPFEKFNFVQVSLDGGVSVINSVNRCSSSNIVLDKTLRGIKKLAENRINLRIVTMMTEDLLSEFDEFYSKIEKVGLFEYPNIKFNLSPIFDYKNLNCSIAENYYPLNQYIKLRMKLIPKCKNTKFQISTIYEFRILRNLLLRKLNKKPENFIHACNIKNGLIFLADPTGKLYWCLCVKPNKNIVAEFNPEIKWHYDEITKMVNKNIFSFDKCQNCELKYVCGAGCHLSLLTNDKNYYQPHCGAFKNEYIMKNLELFL